MKLRVGLILLVWLAAALLPAKAQAPVPVAERTTTQFGRTTRVSLFSNHMVVVAIRSETEDYLHQAKLEFDEYMVYLQALERFSGEIGTEPVGSGVESRDSISELVLHVGPDSPKIFCYSPLASLDLSLRKIVTVMDDIQSQALEALPGEYELNQWQPAVGDCVELRQGGEACITTIGEDGAIVMRRKDIAMTITVAKANRAEVILKIIEPAP